MEGEISLLGPLDDLKQVVEPGQFEHLADGRLRIKKQNGDAAVVIFLVGRLENGDQSRQAAAIHHGALGKVNFNPLEFRLDAGANLMPQRARIRRRQLPNRADAQGPVLSLNFHG